jgi:hypothetical protein
MFEPWYRSSAHDRRRRHRCDDHKEREGATASANFGSQRRVIAFENGQSRAMTLEVCPLAGPLRARRATAERRAPSQGSSRIARGPHLVLTAERRRA